MKKVILVFFVLFCETLSAQKYMHVGQKGGIVTTFPMDIVDSVYFSGYEEDGISVDSSTHNLFSPSFVTTYKHKDELAYNGIAVDGNIVYAVGGFGIRKIDYSDKANPKLVAENKLYSKLSGRSVALADNDYVYVMMRSNTSTTDQNSSLVNLRFESNIKEFISAKGESVSNNSLFNSFFKELNISTYDLGEFKKCYIYKARPQADGTFKNSILLASGTGVNLSFCAKTYKTEAEALSDLSEEYSDAKGNSCRVDWNAITSPSNSISNFEFNMPVLGSFDSYEQKGNITVDECGNGAPVYGNYSLRFRTESTVGKGDYAKLVKKIKTKLSTGSLSAFIKVENVPQSDIVVPLLQNSGQTTLSLILKPEQDKYSVNICVDKDTFACEASFEISKWNNFKININKSSIEFFNRSQEMGDWIELSSFECSPIEFDCVGIGMETTSINTTLYVDDVFFDSEDIDKTNYLNGKLVVLNKSDLSIVNSYSMDLQGTGSFINDKLLITCFLRGYNVYDISTNPSNPKLLSYGRDVSREFQGVDVFQKDNKLYAFFCNYAKGVSIVDISNPEFAAEPVNIIYPDNFKSGNDVKLRAWDVKVKYPYAYVASAPNPSLVGTEDDWRGIVVYNLCDLTNVTMEYYPIDKNDYWQLMTNPDRQPTQISYYDKYLFVNNEERGVCVFEIGDDGTVVYKENIDNASKSCINALKATSDGYLYVGEGLSGTTTLLERNLKLYKIIK